MPEDRQAILAHVGGVREQLYPEIQIDRFPDARRMVSRFEGIVADWESGKAPDATGIVTAVNEIVVAIKLLAVPLTAHFQMVYEPRVTLTGQSIDLLLTSGEEKYYFDIKTIRPAAPENTRLEWEKYGRLRQLFPANADLILAEKWMGAEFWHFFSSARAKFLDHALGLENKIASLPKNDKQIVRIVFCGDKIRWREDQLEDFADFYFRGIFRQDDPFRELQAHYLKQKGIQIERSIGGFCYMERPVLELRSRKFTLDVHAPMAGR